ncbi:MAG: ATP-binding protein [Chlorobi bacterium]|nr:ATP-binding protein [Chlorobiota bacterium]
MKRRIFVITGPESTGKTTLAADLSVYFQGTWIPEYARKYVENLNKPYTYDDVERITKHQIGVIHEHEKAGTGNMLFLDTDLIILKVWFGEVYSRVPEWLEGEILRRPVSGYLLCATDLPWLPDPVRENPGNKREALFRIYQEELQNYGFPYRVVHGRGKERIRRAIVFIREMLKENTSEL